MRILIAEDDPISRILLQATLRKWGHDPIVSTNGQEALLELQKDDAPRIAILDWMMPEMEGPEVCRQVRRIPTSRRPYIILLTAKARREDLVVGLESGADDYVTKPFDRHELYARLQAGLRIVELQSALADRVQELEVALTRLRGVQQAQKLEALGQIASGIAHEINTPTQYIGDNIRFIRDSWTKLQAGLERFSADDDTAYLIQEIPKAIADSLQGLQRVSGIVGAMRDFSHPVREYKAIVDINRAIETTIVVATSEWKYVADVEVDLDPNLPSVLGHSGELHQVFLNLLVNAAHAVADVQSITGDKGLIRIQTRTCDGNIEIRISDTGSGIPEEHRAKVFEPFFTTKDVGKGTGQGLAIAYSVITRQHNGNIWFESEVGRGTTFVIHIPIYDAATQPNAQEEANSICG